MRQIYDFEQKNPPILNENMLRNTLEKRRAQKQTVALAIAGVLVQILVLLLGFIVGEIYPVAAMLSICYVIISMMGSSVIAVMFVKKEVRQYE